MAKHIISRLLNGATCLAAVPVVFGAVTALAEEKRQLDAHEHGVGELTIAMDGGDIEMELHAPGADIVGFEHPAESAEDRAAIAEAVAVLSDPMKLFTIPDAAGCTVVSASAGLKEEHEHDAHDDDDHAEEKHAEHDHDDHAEEKHAEHDDHDDHAGEETHTEFYAAFAMTCSAPSEITEIAFPYFDLFPNARELEVQAVSPAGAKAFEVERDAPTLDLGGML